VIGLDTNVLVRYLVQDDLVQSAKANQLIEEAVLQKKTIWIALVSLCETVWVLTKCYKLSKLEVTTILQQLLCTTQIKIENEKVARLALSDFESHKGVGFADCLIGRQNLENGCEFTYTFDRAAFEWLPAIYSGVS
jgi:predicted nucleic-acid-binding protein